MSEPKKDVGVLIKESKSYEVVEAFGDQMILRLGTDDTDGKLCVWTNISPPGGGPPPHFHDHEDELFMPISGPVEFFLGSEWTQLEAGSTAFAPRGTIHAFRNPSDTPLEMIIQTMPGGFDHFFRECSAEFKDGSPNMKTIVEISARYGIHYV